MAEILRFPFEPHRVPAVMAILARYNRQSLQAFIEIAIDLADALDGDPDLEGECSEDEISRCTDWGDPVRGNGPGCDIADPDMCVDDDGEYVDEREPEDEGFVPNYGIDQTAEPEGGWHNH